MGDWAGETKMWKEVQSREGWMVTLNLFGPAQPLCRSTCDGEERWQPAHPELGCDAGTGLSQASGVSE